MAILNYTTTVDSLNDRYLFRGKRIDNGEWVEGLIWKKKYNTDKIFISCFPDKDDNEEAFVVDSETICQYTGLTDRNGNKIWENDVLSIARKSDCIGVYYYPPIQYPVNVKVRWDMCAWVWETIGEQKYYISFPDAWCHYEPEVIGNIFDNPELL